MGNYEPGKKLLLAFRDKNAKNYATSDTALLVDMTEVSQKVMGKNVVMSLDEFEKNVMAESKFGVAIFFTSWIDHSSYTTSLIASKIIFSDSCNPLLKTMLETLFFHKNTISKENSNLLNK